MTSVVAVSFVHVPVNGVVFSVTFQATVAFAVVSADVTKVVVFEPGVAAMFVCAIATEMARRQQASVAKTVPSVAIVCEPEHNISASCKQN